MRYLCLIGLAPGLPGCALERTVAYAYCASTPPGDTFPRQSEFVRECGRRARYGLVAVRDWASITTFLRIRSATRDRANREPDHE
jgi:hypothetical protein